MDFSQYLNDYLTIKRLQGVTPGRKTSTALFAPYFDRQSNVNLEGRRMTLAEQAQTFKEKQQGENLAWGKERTMAELAGAKDITLSRLAGAKDISMAELAGTKDISMNELAWNRQRAIDALALEKWQQQLLMDQAARNDTKATIGNVVSTVGSLGSMYALKRYGWR